MCLFAGTLPATRLAVTGFDPLFLTVARAAIAGITGLIVIVVTQKKFPPRSLWAEFVFAGLFTVVCFPLSAGFAMVTLPAAHGGVVLGVCPLATATAAAIFAHWSKWHRAIHFERVTRPPGLAVGRQTDVRWLAAGADLHCGDATLCSNRCRMNRTALGDYSPHRNVMRLSVDCRKRLLGIWPPTNPVAQMPMPYFREDHFSGASSRQR